MSLDKIKNQDPSIYAAMQEELHRQKTSLELIPSENLTSLAVMEAQGSVLTNKYAEGYPGKRYYGGCEFVDKVEEIAIDRAKKLFGSDHANVQAHSGSQANMAVYLTSLQPGDTILGMDLSHGGHLTHGHSANFSGKLFRPVFYGVRKDDHRIDMNHVREQALQHRPKMIVAGASAYSRIIDFAAFAEVAKEVGALFMVDMAHIAGLVAAGEHPTPVPHADFVTTTTHKTLRGPRGGLILCKEKFQKSVNSRIFPGIQGGPLMHVIAAKAVALGEAMTPAFKAYQRQVVVNAKALAETLMGEGLNLVSGGTDNHLLLIDLRNIGITGKEGEERLDRVGLTVNKNTVPFETESAFVTSGVRLGTPAITTRGLVASDMQWMGKAIAQVLKVGGEQVEKTVRGQVEEICRKYPLYNELG